MQRLLQQILALALIATAAAGIALLSYWWLLPGSPPIARPRAKHCGGRYELIIRNGKVLDGTGGDPVRVDVGINAGRITCVGDLSAAAAENVIDAANLTVAPGFIDVHTHVERNLPDGSQPFVAANFLQQGVTTIITGNCGRSALPIGEMFAQLEKNGTQINVAGLVGHNSVRRRVMGEARREPTPTELAEMQRLVAHAMEDGALGLSTGLVYEPGMYSQRDELIALARTAAARGGIYVTHLRDEGAAGEAAIREAIEVGAAADSPVHISHFKAQGRRQWGTAGSRLRLIDEARRSSLRVTIDQYPYVASSTTLEVLLPDSVRAQTAAQLRQSLQRPQERARLREDILASMRAEGWPDFSFARVAYCPSNTALNGLSVAQLPSRLTGTRAVQDASQRHPPADEPSLVSEAATADNPAELPPAPSKATPKESSTGTQEPTPPKESPAPLTPSEAEPAPAAEPADVNGRPAITRKASAPKARTQSAAAPAGSPQSEVERQADAILDLLANGGAQMIYFDMDEPDVLAILKHQDTMIGSDSGVRLENAPAVPHPRGSGTFPRILSRYVRDSGLLSLAEAVRRMTSLPAQTFGLSDRGRIAEGYWADFVIFDPATIYDQATYENPLLPPRGISYVIVNGVITVSEGHVAKLSAGAVVRRQ